MLSDDAHARVYRVEGLLYFGSVRDFAEKFQPGADPARVVLDFHEARVCDLSGLEALQALATRYRKVGKTMEVRHLSPDCGRMLARAGDLIEITVAADDPQYLVARLPLRSEAPEAARFE